MPINVTCPGCMKRFSVADKFAGQKGPCPKCKHIITIPKKEEEVIIHAPDHSEAGAIGAGGRHVLKTYKRKDTKFQPLVFTGVAGFVLVALLVARVFRSAGPPESWLR
jgi:phage FluMu protein Com